MVYRHSSISSSLSSIVLTNHRSKVGDFLKAMSSNGQDVTEKEHLHFVDVNMN